MNTKSLDWETKLRNDDIERKIKEKRKNITNRILNKVADKQF